jgi:uncharacterized protein (DUF952 family)
MSMSEDKLIYHLITTEALKSQNEQSHIRAASLDVEGFVHCSNNIEQVLQVANHFYKNDPSNFVVLELSVQAITSANVRVVFEAPTGVGTTEHDSDRVQGDLFPHVYGALPRGAILRILHAERSSDGSFTKIYDSCKGWSLPKNDT